MWNKQKKNKVSVASINTLISADTVIEGNIHFSGGLQIDGTVHGNVIAVEAGESLVRVTRTGRVCGDVVGPNVFINGKVEGSVASSYQLELATNATVIGNVQYNLLEMAAGAEVEGSLHHYTDQEISAAELSSEVIEDVSEVNVVIGTLQVPKEEWGDNHLSQANNSKQNSD